MIRKKNNKSHALFSSVCQRVLILLYLQPDRSFYTNEIIQLSKSGTGAVQRELKKLSALELINTYSTGNQRHYQANRSSLIFSEIHSIIIKTFGLADVVNQALNTVSDQIRFAFIYGSIASGKENVKSDIDLMIISDTLTYAEIFSLLEKPQKKLGRKINPTFYSEKDWIKKHKMKNHFVMQVLKKQMIFLIGSVNEFKQLG